MTLALDIGATNIRIANVKKINIQKKQKIKHSKNKKEILSLIIDLVDSYEHKEKICIAIAGFERNGKIEGAINWDFNGIPLRKILQDKFKIPVKIQNDARCAGLAELKFGAGKNFENFVLLTLGTGIGGAIIINKKLYLGEGTAGEIGSMILEKEIFEHLASGSAYNKLMEKENVPEATKKIGHYLGLGLTNLSYILHPQAFILGGGFSEVKSIYPIANSTLKKFYKINPKPKILRTKFGDDAGLIGAALLS